MKSMEWEFFQLYMVTKINNMKKEKNNFTKGYIREKNSNPIS